MAVALERRIGGAASMADAAGSGTNRHHASVLPWVSGPDPRGEEPPDSSGKMVKAKYLTIRQKSFAKLVMAIAGLASQLSAADQGPAFRLASHRSHESVQRNQAKGNRSLTNFGNPD